MSERDVESDWLWDRSGPVDPEVARAEALLAPLRMRTLEPPRLGSPTLARRAPAPTRPPISMPLRVEAEPARSHPRQAPRSKPWWPALASGFAVAAGILIAIALSQPDASHALPDATEPMIQPGGRPSPDLKDPFGHSSTPPPAGELRDPFGDSPVPPSQLTAPSPDLKDPFGSTEPGASRDPFGGRVDPPPTPNRADADLKDPFRRDGEPPAAPAGELVDPFPGSTQTPAKPDGDEPDLKDPFAR